MTTAPDGARMVRAALTQTKNVYRDMPSQVGDLARLADRLEDIRAANLDHHRSLIQAAGAMQVDLICLGELFSAPYFALDQNPMWRALAEDAEDGPTVSSMRKIASETGVIVVAPIYERDSRSGRCFNTAVIIDETGTVLGSYRKTHIPKGTNNCGSYDETYYYDASDGGMRPGAANISSNPFFPVFQTRVGALGVAICYDRHFEGVIETLAQHGAQIILSPAVTFGAKSQRMWDLEFEVDAVRHRVFIGGSNRLGAEPPWNIEYFGRSYFVGPEGRPAPIEGAPPELIIADLPMDTLTQSDSAGWDIKQHARPEIYGALNS